MPASHERRSAPGPVVRSTRSRVISSKAERVTTTSRCRGPAAFCAMKGRFTGAESSDDSSFFACAAASRTRCTATGSRRTSTPGARWNASTR